MSFPPPSVQKSPHTSHFSKETRTAKPYVRDPCVAQPNRIRFEVEIAHDAITPATGIPMHCDHRMAPTEDVRKLADQVGLLSMSSEQRHMVLLGALYQRPFLAAQVVCELQHRAATAHAVSMQLKRRRPAVWAEQCQVEITKRIKYGQVIAGDETGIVHAP